MAKIKKFNFFRKPLQWAVVIFLFVMVLRSLLSENYVADIEAYCPFGGLQSLGSYFVNGTLACSMTMTQIAMGLALFVGIIIFSKLFCSYVCPLGIFSECLGKYGEKLKLRYTLKGFADRALRVSKYVLLFLTFYYTIGSSELFCKKFDPYYAFFSGFDHEIDLTYALIAIFILFAGSFFLRLAWCKYFCPLSALTNIFANSLLILPLITIYLLVIWVTPLVFSWLALLIIIVSAGFLFEFIRMKFFIFPFFNVTRNTDSCTNCRLCDKACPMGIKVSEADISVKHIDCHMCGDCVSVCPEKNTLNINKKSNLRWLMPVAALTLFFASLIFASRYELPTISEFWGSDDEIENAEIFTIEGLKTVKCYGSSMSFALHLRGIEGIVGVKTYVKKYRAEIYFNSDIISHDEVGKHIFTPASNVINLPSSFNEDLARLDIKVDRYFDEFDAYYILKLMQELNGMYAFIISYGEPAPASFFFNPEVLKPIEIKEKIEQKVILLNDGINDYEQKIDFIVDDFTSEYELLKGADFFKQFFSEFNYKFNKHKSFSENDIAVYSVSLDEFPGEVLNDNLLYLMSHVSANKSIISLSTEYKTDGLILKAEYLKDRINESEVMKWITSPELKILYDDGEFEILKNEIKYKN